jgi:hypothetical protein
MKRFIIIFLSLGILSGCNNSNNNSEQSEKSEVVQEEKFYGLKKISPEGAINSDSVLSLLDKNEGLQEIDLGEGIKTKGIKTKIEGSIVEMCQMSGCWFTFKTADGKEITISMREHKETPKEWAGKTVVAEGAAYIETIGIEELRHKAKEEGASRDEISRIKDPKVNYHFIADGATLKK